MSPPRTADVHIDIEAPSDPSKAASGYSRAPSRQSHRSHATARPSEAPSSPPTPVPPPGTHSYSNSNSNINVAPAAGITISIGPDGSTTINVVRLFNIYFLAVILSDALHSSSLLRFNLRSSRG